MAGLLIRVGSLLNRWVSIQSSGRTKAYLCNTDLVLQSLDELVEACGDDRSKNGANPVKPVVRMELLVDDARTERASGIE